MICYRKILCWNTYKWEIYVKSE